MHNEVLTKEQKNLLPLIAEFKKDFYLVGGTAIALQIGHRYSIDFDLFSFKEIKRKRIINIITKNNFNVDMVHYEDYDQMHLSINNVKVTFFQYEYKIEHPLNYNDVISMPSLLDLAAMKAYELGGRAKWKDYVDLYFLLKYNFSFKQISDRAIEIFENYFNERLFKEEISYFKDISYTEQIEYVGTPIPEEEIKEFLIDVATEPF